METTATHVESEIVVGARTGGAPVGEVPADGGTRLDDLASLEIANVVTIGDSPLANSLRRRKREADRPDDTIASHDSVI